MKFLITAGPTREYIDPVRFISSPSSGKMGFALADCAKRMGHDVVLISGPAAIDAPRGVKTIRVVCAEEMKRAVFDNLKGVDAVIMAAAVSDFAPAARAAHKIKKDRAGLSLRLRKTPDILLALGGAGHRYFLAGFAAETDNLLANARKKLRNKGLDMIVANYIGEKGTGFGADENEAVIMTKEGKLKKIPKMPKTKMAGIIIREIVLRIKK